MVKRLIVVCLLILSSCIQKDGKAPRIVAPESKLRYAEGFSISNGDGYKLLQVKQPFQGALDTIKYLLVPKGNTVPKVEGAVVIRTPIDRIVCTSTTHIPLLDYLGVSDHLCGFPTPDFISSAITRKLIDAGKVADIGVDNSLNIEKLAYLKPDMLLGYTMTGDFGQFKKIQALNIPVVINAEYLEKHPLGRAEWIKFVAAFFDKDAVADSVFQSIENEYIKTKALTQDSGPKPSVMSGIMYGDAWFLPGGRNYASTLISDAGADYLWNDDPSNGFLQLGFETVFEKAHDADLWLGVGSVSSLDELAATDSKYKLFNPYKTKSVYNYDKRKGARGGKDCALALFEVLRNEEAELIHLHTIINAETQRVGLHGIAESMIDLQAKAIGVPVVKGRLHPSGENAEYEKLTKSMYLSFREQGISHIVFGDIFLGDLRIYRETLLRESGLIPIFPLWGRPTNTIIREFLANEFRTIICAANEACYNRDLLGKVVDMEFVDNLPEGADPCGENGEFHTYVFDAPFFKKPIGYTLGEIVRRDYQYKKVAENGEVTLSDSAFWFQDVAPL